MLDTTDTTDQTVQPLYIGPEQLLSWIDRLRPHIQKMADGSGGRFLAGDILTCLATGAFQCFVAMEAIELRAVMLTEIVHYPRFRAMRCIGISGHQPQKWTHLMAAIEAAAKQNFGCQRMEALVQPGHERLLITPGWHAGHTLFEKDLPP